MRFGIDISPAGEWGSPRSLSELAALAERSGWDGVFLEDYVVHPSAGQTYDAWVALAAIALVTERIKLGTMVTPLPARAPWQVASQAVTVDHLSGGRLILGVGSGDPESLDVNGFGGPRERALRFDGACLYRVKPPAWEDLEPQQIAALKHDAPAGFEIAVGGRERREDEAAEREYIGAIAAAGATWWHEYLSPATPIDKVRRHIERGPLREPGQA